MRIAVLGVGLIGGSIGLAARRRAGARVTGYDPDRATLERALELGALDAAAGSLAEAVAGAEAVICAAPVGALPELVASALDATGEGTVVSDVGSTKRALVEAVAERPDGERFIGGHPLAGAETSGVENARAELFEGARWYLTPTGRSSGILYDRLQRLVAALGARPQAIPADAHDRMMATVSHLPHVIANVLVERAGTMLGADDRLPEVGPSFRDSTRVAGSNPAIWADIFAANREVLAAEAEGLADRLREAARLLRSGDRDAIRAWQSAAASERRRLLERGVAGGELRQLRISVENRPGTVAEIALALGRAGLNIEDMALHPAPDMRTGAISIWVAGPGDAERAAAIVRGLGHAVAVVAAGE